MCSITYKWILQTESWSSLTYRYNRHYFVLRHHTESIVCLLTVCTVTEAADSAAHLYGEAGCVSAAGVCAVSSCLKGSCTGALRRQHHVMVDPLTPIHQQVGQCAVHRDVVIVCVQHFLRHKPHLDD